MLVAWTECQRPTPTSVWSVWPSKYASIQWRTLHNNDPEHPPPEKEYIF